MNILVINDDGPNALGVRLLRDEVKRTHKDAKVVALTPKFIQTGTSMSVTPRPLDGFEVEQADTDWYVVDGTPTDMVHIAFEREREFLKGKETWDVVLTGVNHGANVGLDLYHSGTVGAAVTAHVSYGCTAFCFAQATEFLTPRSFREDGEEFNSTKLLLRDYLINSDLRSGECWNVNFPRQPAEGIKDCRAAHYSRFRTPSLELVPRARDEENDIYWLNMGYLTQTQLQPRMNPLMGF